MGYAIRVCFSLLFWHLFQVVLTSQDRKPQAEQVHYRAPFAKSVYFQSPVLEMGPRMQNLWPPLCSEKASCP